MLALIIVTFALFSSCVDTAECDATVPCEDDEVCYDYQCRRACETEDDCNSADLCAPCMQDDAEGTIDHCFEADDFACVPETE